MEQSRRGFLAILAGVIGAAFLPKAKAKPTVPNRTVVPADMSGQLSYVTRRSSMAYVTTGSSVVVCDKGIDVQPGHYIAGRGIPTGSQVVCVSTAKVFTLDRPANESGHTLIAIDPDPCSAIIELRMNEAGEAMRDLIGNTML